MLLREKVIVVSGVGPGLGRSIAVQSARAGATVVLAARTESRLEEVSKEIAEIAEIGGRTCVVPTDIDSDASAAKLAETVLETFGRVDALVNNAFAMPPMADLAEADLEAVAAGFHTNVVSALRLTRLFAPALADSRGSVVMINRKPLPGRELRTTTCDYRPPLEFEQAFREGPSQQPAAA
ncbi:SDR family NAD(P)-dependent oxidoreductase [Nocardia uniformis]|uniref:SDR family NAD(P)-dependent oxidoreductase n=1 Tax=Nocardia uniformis TaxID=53432 RepID=A0A849CHR5_9NOCA|nr:SDR family NAD(P)-dependent oxidoreductase [Nocardia uniformis]NNH73241.1 SDR family NAD(P)-dependent oxidoreductase [Nocardia uniformis]